MSGAVKRAVHDCSQLPAFQLHPPCPASLGRGRLTCDKGAEHRSKRQVKKLECTFAHPPITLSFVSTCSFAAPGLRTYRGRHTLGVPRTL